MRKEVPDTEENMEICKQFCGLCPTFRRNGMNNIPPHVLFCTRGKTESQFTKCNIFSAGGQTNQILIKGCSCSGCEIFKKYEIEGGMFCIYGIKGKK